ncbi:MAG: hypothetical protein IJF76_00195 [Clostridia bacterium]|nr:hypothetical protein [Clostridia bacterium]
MYKKKKVVLRKENSAVCLACITKTDKEIEIVLTSYDLDCDSFAICDRRNAKIYPLSDKKFNFTNFDGDIECALVKDMRPYATGSTRADGRCYYIQGFLEKEKREHERSLISKKREETPPKVEIKKEEKKEVPQKPKEVEERKRTNECDYPEFYLSVKQNFEEMFVCFPRVKILEDLIPSSEWVRVDREDGFYVVGVIKENLIPRYLCYGMPGEVGLTPPTNMQKYCQWLPINDNEEGYWVVFQDAFTGETLEK